MIKNYACRTCEAVRKSDAANDAIYHSIALILADTRPSLTLIRHSLQKTNPKWTFDAPNTSTIVSFLITTSVMFFWFVVKLSMVDSIYYVFTTLSTLGFGDLSLVSRSSRLLWPVRMVTLVLSLIGVYLIGSFSAYVVAGRLDLAPTTSSSPARRSIQSMPSVIFLFLVGSFSLWKLEPSLTFADSVYFVFSTLTTLGLGDVVCKTALGKLFIGVFSIVGAMVFGAVLGCVAIIPLQAVQKKERELAMDEIPDELNRETFEYLINGERVRYLELSQDPKYCTRDEFTLLMLVDLGIVEEEDLAMCREKFEKLDVDNSGRITKRDLDLLAARNVVRKVAAKVLYSWLPFGKGRGRTAMQEEEAEEVRGTSTASANAFTR